MKKNNLGQAAVVFIILIPVFLIITTLIVDTGINMYNEKKHRNVTEDVLTTLLEQEIAPSKLEERAKLIYENNDIDTENLYIELLSNDRIKISNSNVYYSFINSLFNKGDGNRQTVVEATGYIENGKVVISFEGDV